MQSENSTSHPQSDGWTFHAETGESQTPEDISKRASSHLEPITWTGSEFIAQHKNTAWYVGLSIFIAVVCAVIYFVSKDFLSVGFIVVMGVLLAVIASRKPRQLHYRIDDHGLQVGKRQYPFNDFKSFSLQRDGAIGYVNLLPLKRLHAELSVYFAPEDEKRIFEVLADRIPNEQRNETMIDKLTKKIRF